MAIEQGVIASGVTPGDTVRELCKLGGREGSFLSCAVPVRLCSSFDISTLSTGASASDTNYESLSTNAELSFLALLPLSLDFIVIIFSSLTFPR